MADPPQWLLLHGTPLTAAVWDDVSVRLREYGKVLAPELGRANGSTDVQRALASQVLAQTRGDVHAVGHSFGGQVAIEVCLAAPERVKSITAICTRDTPFPAFAAAADALMTAAPVDIGGAMSRWFRPRELDADGPIVQYARRCLETADRQVWAQALRAIAAYDSSHDVPSIVVPITAIAAELDRVSTPNAMTALVNRARHGRLHVLPDAAHMSPFIDPDGLAELIVAASRR